MKKFSSKAQKIGEIGEDLACRFLMKNGFSILERNYTKKWGEIDVVAKKGGVLHFIEVKAGVSYETSNKVTHETVANQASKSQGVPHETKNKVSYETYRPEENVHPWKLKRLFRTVEGYLAEKNLDLPWQIDIAVVKLNLSKKVGQVTLIENITV
ncbi:MAG TPA: YraN family protein [Candidatus Paceibacterota bacterium]|nr:YraN family protein [Candidatus Paceibacterota bacterium]